MKFDNEDAFRLTQSFMNRKEIKSDDSDYFVEFLRTYERFDKWLSSTDPIGRAIIEKKQSNATVRNI